ncbi:hypothetical protein BY996DRAFT_6579539 [Phakopsora pachyrhizi]|nr:hypothetical protein BY996DRAFT_6579539 [Phakopsora pachyrhizi]
MTRRRSETSDDFSEFSSCLIISTFPISPYCVLSQPVGNGTDSERYQSACLRASRLETEPEEPRDCDRQTLLSLAGLSISFTVKEVWIAMVR